MIAPAIKAKAEAIAGPGMSGRDACVLMMMLPTRVDMTATGPIVMLHKDNLDQVRKIWVGDLLFRGSKEPVDHHTD